MREIKFRAWDECNADGECMVYASLGELVKSGYGEFNLAVDEDDAPVMQYTGLKDKNGVEIYEGDILEGFSFETVGTKLPVIWFNNMSQFVANSEKGIYWINADIEEGKLQVIGNIYEHPHLLNGDR